MSAEEAEEYLDEALAKGVLKPPKEVTRGQEGRLTRRTGGQAVAYHPAP